MSYAIGLLTQLPTAVDLDAEIPADPKMKARIMRFDSPTHIVATLVAFLWLTPSLAQESSNPTARDLYVGCSLLVHRAELKGTTDPSFGPRSCSSAIAGAYLYNEGRPKTDPHAFCPPQTAAYRAGVHEAAASAYIDFVEGNPKGIALLDADGTAALIIALRSQWSCK